MADRDIPIIETRDLVKYFKTNRGQLHAVDHVDLKIYERHTLGVVGESGCGKSTLGRSILRLTEPTGGEVLYEGEDILPFHRSKMHKMREKMQIIFQDPYASLNPRMTVRGLIEDPLRVYGYGKSERTQRAKELMDIVGLAERFANSYPHELDGGRRQRIGIARALALAPKFVVCDEPVSALDVSIQAQILNLLMDLQETQGLTYMFITHDLSVVRHVSDEILVMYMGVVVEQAKAAELFINPIHPYTVELIKAIPMPDLLPEHQLQNSLRGEVSNPISPPPGCRFAPRCNYCTERCATETPPFEFVDGTDHKVACWLYSKN